MKAKYLYTVLLTVLILLINACGGGSGDDPETIDKSAWSIIADAGRNDFVTTESRVVLDGSSSNIKNETNKPTSTTTIINYNWTFIGDPPLGVANFPELSNITAVNPSFTPPADGEYELQLKITDTNENTNTQTSTVKVVASSGNSRPVVNAGKNQQAGIGVNVVLNGSQSRDANADTLSYRWEFVTKPEGSNISLDDSTAVQPTFSPDKTGDYQFKLIVNDGQVDSEEDTVTISVSEGNSQPLADAGTDINAKEGEAVSLNGSSSRDNDGNAITYQWFFTAIPSESTIPELSNATTATPSFMPDTVGTYVVSLVVNDGTVDSQYDSVMIKVTEGNVAPVANAGLDQRITVGGIVILSGVASYDDNGDDLMFNWTPANGNPAVITLTEDATVKASFSPIVAGEYRFDLVVNDGLLDSNVDTVIVKAEINHGPMVSITSPESGANFTITDTITLVGEGNDEEEGVLPASALTWQSDKDGELCQGKSSCAVTLSVGSHAITLTGQDSTGVTTDAVITVIVNGDTGSLTEGLLAYYSFGGNANDTSNNSHHGEIHGAFLTADRHNAKNSAYQFDGSQSYIDLKIERSTYPKFSMCTWYQYLGDINADHQTLFSGDTTDFWVGKDKGNSNIGVQEGNYNPSVAIGTNAWDGEWHHLCYVYDEGVIVLYLDNKNVGMANVGQGSGPIWLGKENEGNGFIFDGIIDEVRLYSRALSSADVNVVFAADDNTGDVVPLLNGIWEGSAESESTWTVKATLAANNSLIDYPSLNCGGNLTLISQTDNSMRFSEKLNYGLPSCVDNGIVELMRLSASELSYAWYDTDGVQQASGNLAPANTGNDNPTLKIVNWDSLGSVTSDVGGINCGEVCSATFETDAEVVLTAVHDNSVTPIWVGCLSTNGDTCTVSMNQDRAVTLSFASIKEEIDANDSFAEAQDIIESTVVTGYLNASDDADFFSFKVTEQGTFKLSSAHPSEHHYIHLYNEQQQEITGARSTAPLLTQTLSPGTYYVRVYPYNNTFDLDTPYTLLLSGSVLGAPLTQDGYEENDSFATAKVIETAGSIQGYLDTSNDADFFSFQVTEQGTFKLSSAHPSEHHYIHLYNEQQQEITGARSTASVLTQTLGIGTYYVRVYPYNKTFDLNIPYTLSFSGSVLGAPLTQDGYEENNSFARAKVIETAGSIQGYLDTSNDADFFSFQVAEQGTFKLSSAHPSEHHYIHLYDEQQQEITGARSTASVLTQTLGIGTYYVRVYPYNNTFDLSTPYTLSFSGSVLGAPLTQDGYEENDSFATAKVIETAGSIQGYLDTSNDADFFSFQIAEQGTFKLSSAHPSEHHYIHLYNEQQQEITGTRSAAPVLTQALNIGTYYVRVYPYNNTFDLNTPYTLSILKE